MASARVNPKAYIPIKLPIYREAYIKAMVVILEVANTALPSPLCANPIIPLVATLTIFTAALDSNSMAPKDKEQVTKAKKST